MMCHTKGMRNILAAFMMCALGFAQSPPAADPPTEGEAPPIRVTTSVVIAPTTVRDRKGDFVDGLQLQDFTLLDNSKPQRITADVRDEPLSLVIAVQRSSNLTEILPKIQRIGSLLNDMIAGQDGEVAVIGFDHRIQVMQDFTTETEKVSEAMKKMTPGSSNHALVDVTMESIRMLQKRPANRRRILLLIAEKRDKGSEGRLRETLTQAEFANVAIYSLDISSVVAGLTSRAMPQPPPPIPATATVAPPGAAVTPTTVDQNYYNGNWVPLFVDIFKGVKGMFVDDTLDVFTRFTGGKEYSFISDKSLEKAVQGISEEIHSQYLLSYNPSNLNEGGFHDIKVVVNRSGLEVRTRPGYWVAARPE